MTPAFSLLATLARYDMRSKKLSISAVVVVTAGLSLTAPGTAILVVPSALRTTTAAYQPPSLSTGVATNVPYADARPILESLRKNLLPEELRTDERLEAVWPAWVTRHDATIRARVKAGDDESVLNLLLFGTTFTARPRATERDIERLGGHPSRTELIEGRIEDLVAGMASSGTKPRLQFARDVLARHGIDVTTPEGARQAQRYLEDGLSRVSAEILAIDGAVQAARSLGDPSAELLERSTLFRHRGLASDTSIFSNFAIDRALNGIRAAEVLGAGRVRRVAIVGPGLDFVDKRDGYDFYPQQTVQPFAVIDSLLRSGLASLDDLQVTTFDLNPRINEHLIAARKRAQAGDPYVLALPRDMDLSWSEGLVRYWEGFGDQIGERVDSLDAPPAAGRVQVRGVRVRPAVVSSIVARDLNIVLQRIEPAAAVEGFDLVVATDILIYYGVFEQSLALTNVAKMLRPGGVFLSNVTLFEMPAIPIESIGYNDAIYLTSPEIGDRLVWYRRQ